MRFSKHTEVETFNRKELVKALSQHLGVRSVYNGMPTRSYTVGPYTIDWDGSIIGEDITPLKDFLIENDYAKAEDFEAQAESQEAHTDEQAPDSEAPCASDEGVSIMFIKIPALALTVPDLKNLIFMLYTKQFLLNRAFGKTLLTISEHLIARLQEYTPESLDEFQAILQDAHALDFLSGFGYEDGKVEMAFPLDVREPEKWPLYSELLNLIIRCAMVTKRTKPVLQKPENERYYMHSWLIRLGCGGPDFKALRRLMIENLNGYCAFPDENRAQKHRDKYKEIRRIRREINEEADRR